MSILRKNKKNITEKEKYSYISKDDLKFMKLRALEIQDELRLLLSSYDNENNIRIRSLTNEFNFIVKELKLYKKYSK